GLGVGFGRTVVARVALCAPPPVWQARRRPERVEPAGGASLCGLGGGVLQASPVRPRTAMQRGAGSRPRCARAAAACGRDGALAAPLRPRSRRRSSLMADQPQASLPLAPPRHYVDLPVYTPPMLFAVVDTEEEFDWDAALDRGSTSVTAMQHIGRAQSIFDRY